MAFDINRIRAVEFLIQKSDGSFYKIAVSADVQDTLIQMIEDTQFELGRDIKEYSPSEKYNSEDKLQIGLHNEYCQNIQEIYNNNNINIDNQQIIDNPEDIIYYFCRLTDNNNENLLAIKKATYFKAVTAQHAWYIQIIHDALEVFSGNLFKLDKSFDILVYDNTVYINKYLVFEGIAGLSETVKLASINNIRVIEQNAPLIVFSEEAKTYIQNHIMAARLVASIKSSRRLENLSLNEVVTECQKQNITINVQNGQVIFDANDTMNFLKLIDRRLFTINLTGEEEKYEAKSRQERS